MGKEKRAIEKGWKEKKIEDDKEAGLCLPKGVKIKKNVPTNSMGNGTVWQPKGMSQDSNDSVE